MLKFIAEREGSYPYLILIDTKFLGAYITFHKEYNALYWKFLI